MATAGLLHPFHPSFWEAKPARWHPGARLATGKMEAAACGKIFAGGGRSEPVLGFLSLKLCRTTVGALRDSVRLETLGPEGSCPSTLPTQPAPPSLWDTDAPCPEPEAEGWSLLGHPGKGEAGGKWKATSGQRKVLVGCRGIWVPVGTASFPVMGMSWRPSGASPFQEEGVLS